MNYIKSLFCTLFIILGVTHISLIRCSPALLLPDTAPLYNYQVLGIVNISNGQLDWITTITSAEEFQLLYTATSADIPLTLVLRDSIGNFAATDITVESLIVTPTNIQGCIIFTDSANNTSGNICANQHALLIAPVAPRALQASDDDIARGISAVDLQMSYLNSAEVASGNYAVITGGQNNSAAAPNTVITGGLSNSVTNSYAVIAGGLSNQVSGNNSFIGTGSGNIVSGNYSALISGTLNSVTNNWSALGAGLSNTLSGSNSLIGAGAGNIIANFSNAIVAGQINTTTVSTFNFIGAGQFNNSTGNLSAIFSGSANSAANIFDACMAGQSNIARTLAGFIGAGISNLAQDFNASVLAGLSNSSRITNDSTMAGQGNTTGGAAASFIGAGIFNTTDGTCCVISGSSNTSQSSLGEGVVMAGVSNINGSQGFIGAGSSNNGLNTTNLSVLAGINNTPKSGGDIIMSGQSNTLTAGGTSFMGAGYYNSLDGGVNEAITTGSGNSTSENFPVGVIMGGQSNTASHSTGSCLAGGFFNACNANYQGILTGSGITLSAIYCMSLCGQQNTASGTASCASGTQATASLGTFLWTDHSTTTSAIVITTNNKFVVRAAGGSYIFTNSTATSGVQLAPGGGSWNNLSDKALKTHYSDIEPVVLLDKLSCMPILEWSFKAQEPTFRHIGPLAQDFHELFDYHEQPLALNTADALGILYAAYKGLYRMADGKKKYSKKIAHLDSIIGDLENITLLNQ